MERISALYKLIKSLKKKLIEKFNNNVFLIKLILQKPIKPFEVYEFLLLSLNPENPGQGVDVFDEKIKDRPMAYGILLSAEANRFKYTGEIDALNIMRKCGNWLIKNADINKNGIYGYGLADPWDAFSDGFINPAHHEYTITTSFAVCGLLDWYQLEPDNEKKELIYNTVKSCLTPYFDDSWDSPLGIPSYSLNENDKKYDVYNSAAMLAGQIQRFSQITTEEEIKILSSNKADKIIRIFIENVLIDKAGNFYWNHSIQKEKPNDLVHAAYIIEGIRDYCNNNGNVKVDFPKISDHILLFKPGRIWYEHADKIYQNLKVNARLWALGMMIFTLARDARFDLIEKTLLKQLAVYRKKDGHFRLKTNDDRTLIRHEAHLMLGLSHYLFNSGLRRST